MCPLQKNACPPQTEASLPTKKASPPQQILHVVSELDGYGLTRKLELLVAAQLAAGQSLRIVALTGTRIGLATLQPLDVDCRVLNRRWPFDPITAFCLRQEFCRQPIDLFHLWGEAASDYFHWVRHWVPPTPTLISLPGQTLLLDRTFGAGTQQSRMIAPGISPPIADSLTREQFLDEQRLPRGSILIAVAGPVTRSQQIDEAIWHYELLRTLDERIRLLIFGDGPDRHRAERFSRLTSEPSSIRFLGYRHDFRDLLPHVNLFWHTAVADTKLPLTILEAMAANVPVVANRGPGCEKIIDDGVNGYLVTGNDRVKFARQTRKVLHDGEHAQQLAAVAASTITEQFSLAAMVRAYADAYAELLLSLSGN